MKKSNYLAFSILIAGVATGYWMDGYIGGIITGCCTVLCVLVIIGNTVYKKRKMLFDQEQALRMQELFESFKNGPKDE